MDPITLMAATTAAFRGIKHAVDVGKEIEGVYKQLSKWADCAGQLQQYINESNEKQPGLFERIGFKKSDTAEAFDIYVAQQHLRQMEAEIYHMFTWGELNHLGIEGHREFIRIRKQVREKREQIIREQLERRRKFIENAFWGTMLVGILIFAYWIAEAFFYYVIQSDRIVPRTY